MKGIVVFILLVFAFASCAIFLPYDTVEGLEIKVESLNNLVSSSQSECIVVVKYKNIGNKPVKLAEHIRGYPDYFWDKRVMILEITKDSFLKKTYPNFILKQLCGYNYPHKILKPNQLVMDTLKVDFGRILDVNSKDSSEFRKNEDYGTYRVKFIYTPYKNCSKKSSKQVESNWAEVAYKK
jgi:hypothetical protein